MRLRHRLRLIRGKPKPRRLSMSGWYAWEQMVLTYAGQASICRIDQNVDALNVEIGYARVVLHACVLEENPDTSVDLEAIRSELEKDLELFVSPAPEVLLTTAVGANGPEWDGFWNMSIYKAHWSTREDT